MRVKFGIGIGYIPMLLGPQDAVRFRELATMADDFGFDTVATYDSAFIAGDPFMRATLIGLATTHARVGLRPTNPVTREPQVMAAFMASLDSLTGGRAFIDLATGDSAVLNAGLRPATRARMREYVNCLRELLAKGSSEFDGRPQTVRWRPTERTNIPIWMTAEGPKMIRLAGELADCVVSGMGLTPEVIRETQRRVDEAAVAAGREPGEIELWHTTRSSLDEDRDRANGQAGALVAGILNHSMRFGLDEKMVPTDLRPSVEEFVRRYVPEEHVAVQGANERLMDELSLREFATKRWAITGNVRDWIGRIEEIADAGARNLWITLGRDDLSDQHARMKLLGEQVLPHFS